MEKPHWIIWFANFEFFFIRSISTVFCCLQSVVWTQIAAWKSNQSLILRWVYSSRDNKHQCLFLCLQIGTEGNSKRPEQLQKFDTFTQRLRTTRHLFSIQLLWKPEILNVEDEQTKFERSKVDLGRVSELCKRSFAREQLSKHDLRLDLRCL